MMINRVIIYIFLCGFATACYEFSCEGYDPNALVSEFQFFDIEEMEVHFSTSDNMKVISLSNLGVESSVPYEYDCVAHCRQCESYQITTLSGEGLNFKEYKSYDVCCMQKKGSISLDIDGVKIHLKTDGSFLSYNYSADTIVTITQHDMLELEGEIYNQITEIKIENSSSLIEGLYHQVNAGLIAMSINGDTLFKN